jgi:hypothetical protein
LPVAITANQTQAGQSSHSTFDHQRRQTSAMEMPTIRASAACRLGIAAYGLAASWTRPLPWLSVPMFASVSGNPKVGNIRGGAVGTTT